MQKRGMRTVVVLGTGGTIAGSAASADDNLGYVAGVLGVGALVASASDGDALAVETEQVAQIDSKDMSFAIWLQLARRVAHHVARAEVTGIVVTHGTDTLEETAYFLSRVVAVAKPVVLTAAMRPATSRQADGPQNLADAIAVAASKAVPASSSRLPAPCIRHAMSARCIPIASTRSRQVTPGRWRESKQGGCGLSGTGRWSPRSGSIACPMITQRGPGSRS